MDRRVFWNTLLVLLVVGILASGGYALYRAGHRQGYREGLAENVDEERLSAFIEQGCDVERWSRNLGWGETHFRPGRGWGDSPPPPVRLAFLVLMLLFLLLVVRAARGRFSRVSGGGGWQLSFGPRPPMDTPSVPEDATHE